MDTRTTTNANDAVAPFVLKTYEMVSESRTDNLIRWGKAYNSFIVVEPLRFSQDLLPAYFKHNNFSSFVRQLNTYGFRKVDPDKWEFANEWFLRGQKHLLRNIARRKHSNRSGSSSSSSMQLKHEDEHGDDIIMEICRLKEEQKLIEEELKCIDKRLEATEKRPEQMMAFLYKVAADPGILPRVIHDEHKPNRDKKRRFVTSNNSPSSSSAFKTEEDDGGAATGNNCNSGGVGNFWSPEIGYEVFYQTQTGDGGGGVVYYGSVAAGDFPVEGSSGDGRFGNLKEFGGGRDVMVPNGG